MKRLNSEEKFEIDKFILETDIETPEPLFYLYMAAIILMTALLIMQTIVISLLIPFWPAIIIPLLIAGWSFIIFRRYYWATIEISSDEILKKTEEIINYINANPYNLDLIIQKYKTYKTAIQDDRPIHIVIKDTQTKIKDLIKIQNKLSIHDKDLIFKLNSIQNHLIDKILKDETYPANYNKNIYIINKIITQIESKIIPAPKKSKEIELTQWKNINQNENKTTQEENKIGFRIK